MGGGYLLNAVVFLVDLVFTLFMIAVLLRFLFQLFRADFFNPIAQALVKITNPVLKPLRKVIPGLFSIDLSAIVLLIIIAIIKTFVVTLINDIVPKIGGVLVLALADCIHLTLNVSIFAIIIRAVVSWINPHAHHPGISLLNTITDPIIRPVRRFIPAMGSIDFSPFFVIIILILLSMLVYQPMNDIGRMMLR